VCTETSTVLRAIAAVLELQCSEIPLDKRIRHIPRCVHYRVQSFRWKRSRISMLELEGVPQSCIL
jgi:hypothetical protein